MRPIPLLILLLGLLRSVAVQAQTFAYTPNITAESAFAEAEYKAIPQTPALPAVPRLTLANVNSAMTSSTYNGLTGSSPFTFVIAHRGTHSAPGCSENSACAIAAAYSSGADGIELDIRTTADGAPVLGHDITVGRELSTWLDSSGNLVTSGQGWGPFLNFPNIDNTYVDLSKYPFLENLSSGAVNPNNPPRPSMNFSQLQSTTNTSVGVLLDSYNQPDANHQLTLFEALYLINKYFPMVVWLDTKTSTDLAAVIPVIQAARNSLPGGTSPSSPLSNINLKMGTGVLQGLSAPFAPADTYGLPLHYFWVVSLEQLNTIAQFDSQPPPTDANSTNAQAFSAINARCTSGNGCMGIELTHKYQYAPTQRLYGGLSTGKQRQLASFQLLPKYSWYWRTLPTDKQQALNSYRLYGRSDGSCCHSLTDLLNVDPFLGSETSDNRNLYSFNEGNFATITTDEPQHVLRDLYRQNKRPTSTLGAIGGSNTTIPSGGAVDGSQVSDGLYFIQTPLRGGLSGLLTAANGTLGLDVSGSTSSSARPSDMWYFRSLSGNRMMLTNINPAGPAASLALGSTASVIPYSNSNLLILNTGNSLIVDNTGQYALGVIGDTGVGSVPAGQGAGWTFIPVEAPTPEESQQQQGPPGYAFCADASGDDSGGVDHTCNLSTGGTVAYGANGSFRYRTVTVPTAIGCEISSFNNIDPQPGVHKACFFAPYGQASGTGLDSTFNFSVSGGQPLAIGDIYAYGATVNGIARYVFGNESQGSLCNASTFGFDPAPNVSKACYIQSYIFPPTGPSGFTFCANEGNNCAFAQTAMVAYGSGSSFTYRSMADGAPCTNATFGLDPDQGADKQCFVIQTPWNPVSDLSRYPGMQTCDQVNGIPTCVYPIGSLISFGTLSPADGYLIPYSQSDSTNILPCDDDFLPYDPAPGQTKICQMVQLPIQARGPAGFTYCATEGGTCQFNGIAAVAFGVDFNFTYKGPNSPNPPLNDISCNKSSFNNTDPYPNVSKACYYRLY